MTLRRKLLSVFAALALMSLLSAGLTIWSTVRQYALLDALEEQYMQSLLLQRIRTTSGTMFRRQALAVLVAMPRGTAHFDRLDDRVRADLEELTQHASRPSDLRMVQRVQAGYESVVTPLLEGLRAAREQGDDPGAPADLVAPAQAGVQAYRDLVDESLERNRQARDAIQSRVGRLRETIMLAVGVSAFGTLCLVMLLAAYVASDIFRPLRELEDALHAAADGNLDRRLDAEREDELGGVVRAFHRVLDAMADGTGGAGAVGRTPDSPVTELPPEVLRRLLYDAVAGMQRELSGRSIAVAVEASPDLPTVHADRARLREALELLLENALSAVDTGGRLWVRAGATGEELDRLVLEVAHDGSPPVDDEFMRGANGTIEAPAAALERVRRVADAHGGLLDVVAEAGRGQRVALELPGLRSRRPPHPPSEVRPGEGADRSMRSGEP